MPLQNYQNLKTQHQISLIIWTLSKMAFFSFTRNWSFVTLRSITQSLCSTVFHSEFFLIFVIIFFCSWIESCTWKQFIYSNRSHSLNGLFHVIHSIPFWNPWWSRFCAEFFRDIFFSTLKKDGEVPGHHAVPWTWTSDDMNWVFALARTADCRCSFKERWLLRRRRPGRQGRRWSWCCWWWSI